MSIGNFIQPNRWDSHTIIITARIINRGASIFFNRYCTSSRQQLCGKIDINICR